MSRFLTRLFAIVAEIEQINDQLNYVVNTDDFFDERKTIFSYNLCI